MKTNLYLDMEGTLIESFSNPEFINVDLSSFKYVHSVKVLTWGIRNQFSNDEENNVNLTSYTIEKHLNWSLKEIIDWQMCFNFIKSEKAKNHIAIDEDDFFEFYGKENFFILYAKSLIENARYSEEYVLIDDTVDDLDIVYKESKITIRNVRNYK